MGLTPTIPAADKEAEFDWAVHTAWSNLDPRLGKMISEIELERYILRHKKHPSHIVEALAVMQFPIDDGSTVMSLEDAQAAFKKQIISHGYSEEKASKFVEIYTNDAKWVLAIIDTRSVEIMPYDYKLKYSDFDTAVSRIYAQFDGYESQERTQPKALEFFKKKYGQEFRKFNDAEYSDQSRMAIIEAVVSKTFADPDNAGKTPSLDDAKRNFERSLVENGGFGENVARQISNAFTDATQRIFNELYPTTKGRSGR